MISRERVIGSISELEKFGPEYDAFFVGIEWTLKVNPNVLMVIKSTIPVDSNINRFDADVLGNAEYKVYIRDLFRRD